MKRTAILLLALFAGSAFAADALVVKGLLLFDSGGLAHVAECGTSRVFTLGVMASNPYFGLTQRYNEASASGKFPVLVEVQGLIGARSSSNSKLVLDSPSIATLVRGTCVAETPNTSFERTREG